MSTNLAQEFLAHSDFTLEGKKGLTLCLRLPECGIDLRFADDHRSICKRYRAVVAQSCIDLASLNL
jgi:hypothetical protein